MCRGIECSNDAYYIVVDYSRRMMLSKLGFKFDGNTLESWEVEAFAIVQNTIASEEEREFKSSSRKR